MINFNENPQAFAFFIAVAIVVVLIIIDLIRESRKSTREKIHDLITYRRKLKNPAPFGYYSPAWEEEVSFIERKISRLFHERQSK